MTGVYVWLIAALFFFIFEMGHPGLFYWLSFALGSLIAATLSWYDYSWHSSGFGFLACSVLSIVLLKHFVVRFIHQHGPNMLTNTDALIGKIGIVTEPIFANKPGRVKLGGEEWLARAYQKNISHESVEHESVLQAGVRVSVIAVRGSHVIVKLVS